MDCRFSGGGGGQSGWHKDVAPKDWKAPLSRSLFRRNDKKRRNLTHILLKIKEALQLGKGRSA